MTVPVSNPHSSTPDDGALNPAPPDDAKRDCDNQPRRRLRHSARNGVYKTDTIWPDYASDKAG